MTPYRSRDPKGIKGETVRLCKVGDRSIAQIAKDLELTIRRFELGTSRLRLTRDKAQRAQ